jgi:hypothetical protein
MAKRATATTSDTDRPEASTDADAAGADTSHICPVGFCPIGAAVNAAGTVRPDAVGHLLVAGRELLLAARAVIDDRADEVDRAVRNLEKIDIG